MSVRLCCLVGILCVVACRPAMEPATDATSSGDPSTDRPRRIVSVAPSATELLFALGAGDRVVGVTKYDDYPPAVQEIPRVGGFLDPNVEAVLSQKPDLVVAVSNAGNRSALERIRGLGISVLVVPGNTFLDVFQAASVLAAALGGDAPVRAAELSEAIRNELQRLHRLVSKEAAPKVAIVYGWEPLVLAGPGSFADTLVRELNGRNVVTTGGEYPAYSVEHLVLDAPEVIIDASLQHGGGSERPWKRWPIVPAIRDSRVHVLTDASLLRAGPRIVDGMRRIAELLHPAVAQSPPSREISNESRTGASNARPSRMAR